jgi:hypothetical protein
MDPWTNVMDLAHEVVDPVHVFFFGKLNLKIWKIARALNFYKNTLNFSKIIF